MFDACRMPSIATRTWFALNTNAIPQALLVGRDGERYDDLTEVRSDPPEPPDWNEEPDEDRHASEYGATVYNEPEPDTYCCRLSTDAPRDGEDADDLIAEERERFAADHAAWKTYDAAVREWIEEREDEEALCMWSTMWQVEDHATIRAAILASGLRLYEHEDVDGVIMGADSCGHSFFGAYWIPLRARIALRRSEFNDPDPERDAALVAMFREEAAREGDGWRLEQVLRELGVPEVQTSAEALRAQGIGDDGAPTEKP